MSIFLIGYRGSGKSTIGRQISQKLNLPFFDSDNLIVEHAGKTIARIFSDDGESHFRDLETQVVKSLAEMENAIIALGGGSLLREENRIAVARDGHHSVYLRASPEKLHERIHADPSTAHTRPSLTHLGGSLAEIDKLLSEREPVYLQAAAYIVEVENKSPDELAAEIIHWMGDAARKQS